MYCSEPLSFLQYRAYTFDTGLVPVHQAGDVEVCGYGMEVFGGRVLNAWFEGSSTSLMR